MTPLVRFARGQPTTSAERLALAQRGMIAPYVPVHGESLGGPFVLTELGQRAYLESDPPPSKKRNP